MRNQINIINARERMTLHIIFHACFSCCSFNLYALPYVIFFKQLIAVVAIKSQINKYEKIVFSSLHISIITCSREPTSLLALSALSHIFRDFMFMLMIFEKKEFIMIPYTRHVDVRVIILCRSLLIFPSIAVRERERTQNCRE